MNDYRTSHASLGYGKIYQQTYQSGYYAAQWEHIEKPLLRRIFQRLHLAGNRRYLDFACGTGRILKVGEEVFEEATGVDISTDMAQHARHTCSRATIHAPHDVTQSPLQQTFDVISAFRFFLNAEPDLRREVLTAMWEMQKPGGYIVCNSHVNSTSILGLTYRLRNRMVSKHVAATLGIKEFTALLSEMGYEVEEKYAYSFWPRLGTRAPNLQELALLMFERLQARIPVMPKGMAQSFILVCRKR